MIISDSEAVARLNNPMNLINSLHRKRQNSNAAMSLFGMGENKVEAKPRSFNPFAKSEIAVIPPLISKAQSAAPLEHPAIADLIDNTDSQIKLSLAHDNALDLLNNSVAILSAKLDEVHPSKLPSVISAASKTVESIRRERLEINKSSAGREVHYHFYTPTQRKIEEYEVIDV